MITGIKDAWPQARLSGFDHLGPLPALPHLEIPLVFTACGWDSEYGCITCLGNPPIRLTFLCHAR